MASNDVVNISSLEGRENRTEWPVFALFHDSKESVIEVRKGIGMSCLDGSKIDAGTKLRT